MTDEDERDALRAEIAKITEPAVHDCEISRSTLNDHLGQLEAVGLLRRVPRLDPVTKRQLPTRYILGFEPGFTPVAVVPCPKIGHGEDEGAETLGHAEGAAMEIA